MHTENDAELLLFSMFRILKTVYRHLTLMMSLGLVSNYRFDCGAACLVTSAIQRNKIKYVKSNRHRFTKLDWAKFNHATQKLSFFARTAENLLKYN